MATKIETRHYPVRNHNRELVAILEFRHDLVIADLQRKIIAINAGFVHGNTPPIEISRGFWNMALREQLLTFKKQFDDKLHYEMGWDPRDVYLVWRTMDECDVDIMRATDAVPFIDDRPVPFSLLWSRFKKQALSAITLYGTVRR